MPRCSLRPGELIAATVTSYCYEDEEPPAWCPNHRDPMVHLVKLLWTPRLDYHSKEAADKTGTLLKSPSFTLKEEWLKGNLATESRRLHSNSLYFQVSPGQEKRILGVAKIACGYLNSSFKTAFSMPDSSEEVSINAATYCGRWKLGPLARGNNLVHVLLNFVILDAPKLEFVSCQTKLSSDFGLLLADKNSTDITIKVGSSELGAHKLVLGLRSSVLKAMLGADMMEGRTGVIELKQMSAEAGEAFLNFIYTAKIDEEKLMETAEELLVAASMYDMPDLKDVCETALRKMISVDNTARLMVLASLHDAALLKSETLDFFLGNKSAVIGTEEWKKAVANAPKLLLEDIVSVI